MSEAFKEQRPLLSEDISEEENFPEVSRRYIYRGRAKNSAKGATAIITRWPEHWSSTLTYWWIGLTMTALTIFIIYNSIIAFVLLPSIQMKPTKQQVPDSNVQYLPEIFMHILVNADKEVDLSKYIPYIEIVADKHFNYNFNLIVLFNDTFSPVATHDAEENNEIALSSLWINEHILKRKFSSRKNISIKQMSLSEYLDESPLKKDWRRIPPHFIEFLVKTISIWDKGGIAINPDILTPRSPNVMYIEKFHNIINEYERHTDNRPNEPKIMKYANKHKEKFRKKVNNIRDIIDILEHEDESNHSQENLIEAENGINPFIFNTGRKLQSATSPESRNKAKVSPMNEIIGDIRNPLIFTPNETKSSEPNHETDIKLREDVEALEIANDRFETLNDINETRLSLLPLFLDFLFHDKPSVFMPKIKQDESMDNSVRQRKDIRESSKEKLKKNITTYQSIVNINQSEAKPADKYKPMIISAKNVVPDDLYKDAAIKTAEFHQGNPEELTVDLKGNIIATKVSCHAFIGTVFSNVVHHHPEETLQDFIIAELSLFCKGVLSSCRGIDLILL